jgi:alpha-1,3-glucan synthase
MVIAKFTQGFGAVGVSKKYGKRSRERYAIFWCLDKIGALPNPDPTDLAPFDKSAKLPNPEVDPIREQQRQNFRRQAQEWAGLDVDPKVRICHQSKSD